MVFSFVQLVNFWRDWSVLVYGGEDGETGWSKVWLLTNVASGHSDLSTNWKGGWRRINGLSIRLIWNRWRRSYRAAEAKSGSTCSVCSGLSAKPRIAYPTQSKLISRMYPLTNCMLEATVYTFEVLDRNFAACVRKGHRIEASLYFPIIGCLRSAFDSRRQIGLIVVACLSVFLSSTSTSAVIISRRH